MTGQRYPIFLRIRKSVLKIHSERLQKTGSIAPFSNSLLTATCRYSFQFRVQNSMGVLVTEDGFHIAIAHPTLAFLLTGCRLASPITAEKKMLSEPLPLGYHCLAEAGAAPDFI